MTRIELAAKYRTKYPETPTLTLAKLIYKENNKLFTSVESVRTALRSIEGKSGSKNKKKYEDRFTDLKRTEARPLNPFADIPRSDAKIRLHTEVDGSKILFLSDIHIPYHDIDALKLALEYGVKENVDCIFLNGDTLDCYQLSRFEKDPRKRSFADELNGLREFLAILRREFPRAKIYYKEGNHEQRFWTYMRIKAPELIGVQAFSLPDLLHLSEFNIDFIASQTKSMIGKLSVFHGHEFGHSTFSPVNVARGLYMRAKANAICGHSHQTSEHTERDVNDKIVTTWSVGCLCELSPDYAPYNKWNHGFAVITKLGDDFHVDNKRIYKGRIM